MLLAEASWPIRFPEHHFVFYEGATNASKGHAFFRKKWLMFPLSLPEIPRRKREKGSPLSGLGVPVVFPRYALGFSVTVSSSSYKLVGLLVTASTNVMPLSFLGHKYQEKEIEARGEIDEEAEEAKKRGK